MNSTGIYIGTGQRDISSQTKESETARQTYYFRLLWALRALAIFIVLIPLPVAWGRTFGACLIAISVFIHKLDKARKAEKQPGLITSQTYPRKGITPLEFGLLLGAGVLLTLAALVSLILDWKLWPLDLWWGFNFRTGTPTVSGDIVIVRRLIEWHRADAPVSGFVLWLRITAIGVLTLALWLPLILLDWRIRSEMQGSNIPNVTILPADPSSLPATPDGISYTRPGAKQELQPVAPIRQRVPASGDGQNTFEEEL